MSNWQPQPGQGPQPYQTPASSFYGAPPPPKRSSAMLWWGLGIGWVVILVCGGGCGGMLWFGISAAGQDIAAQLRDNPLLRAHIGEIKTLKIDLVASGMEEDNKVFVYQVKGSKASGKLTIREGTGDNFETIIERATLTLSDGTEVVIVP